MDMSYCLYFDSDEQEKHMTDVKPCTNCGVPVCSSCRDERGFCLECVRVEAVGGEAELYKQAVDAKTFMKRCDNFGVK